MSRSETAKNAINTNSSESTIAPMIEAASKRSGRQVTYSDFCDFCRVCGKMFASARGEGGISQA